MSAQLATQAKQPASSAAQATVGVLELPATQYYYGLGRRKRAIAQVRLYAAGQLPSHSGKVVVNGKPLSTYIAGKDNEIVALKPLIQFQMSDRFFVSVKVQGGGKSGQAGAISLGIARALVAFDEDMKKQLKALKLLTRDSREKERKKYGLRKARKAHQYTKR